MARPAWWSPTSTSSTPGRWPTASAVWPSRATWATLRRSRRWWPRPPSAYGRVDVFCSNAGYSDPVTFDLSLPFDDLERITRVNLLSHVAAAKAVLPGMVERGSGYLFQTLSSAALISGPATAAYTLTQTGCPGFAEWLAVTYRPQGIRVSCLCPNTVYTGMFGRPKDLEPNRCCPTSGTFGEMLLPEDVAVQTVDAMEGDEPFLILPHPRVGDRCGARSTTTTPGSPARRRGWRRCAVADVTALDTTAHRFVRNGRRRLRGRCGAAW